MLNEEIPFLVLTTKMEPPTIFSYMILFPNYKFIRYFYQNYFFFGRNMSEMWVQFNWHKILSFESLILTVHVIKRIITITKFVRNDNTKKCYIFLQDLW